MLSIADTKDVKANQKFVGTEVLSITPLSNYWSYATKAAFIRKKAFVQSLPWI